jgi:hypothetical protein
MNDSIGLGTGLQTSSVPGAKVTFTFVGSALYISGELEGQLVARAVNNYYPTLPAVETQLDGDGSPGSGNFSIFGSTDMPSEYNITLTLVSGTFSLSGLVVSAPLGGYGWVIVSFVRTFANSHSARGTSKTVPMLDYSDNISSDVNAIGEWRTINTFCGYTWDSTLDYSVNQCWDGTYPCAASGSQNARLSFNVPANASIFTVYGTMGTSYGPFQIGTQDYIYDDPSLTYTAQSPWSRRAVALYSGTLDPRTANTINIDYLGTPEDYSTIEIYQVVYFLAVG